MQVPMQSLPICNHADAVALACGRVFVHGIGGGSYLVSFVSNVALKKVIPWMHGAKFIRPVFLAVVLALTVKLIWDAMQM